MTMSFQNAVEPIGGAAYILGIKRILEFKA